MKNFRKSIGEIIDVLIIQPFRDVWYVMVKSMNLIWELLLILAMFVVFRFADILDVWMVILTALFVLGFRRWLDRKKMLYNQLPVPDRRFTSENEFGEVEIDYNDLNEIILYLGEFEDFLQKTGRLEERKGDK